MNIITLKNRNYRIKETNGVFQVHYFSINKKTGKEHQGIKFIPCDKDAAKWFPYVQYGIEFHIRGYETLDEAVAAIHAHAA